MRHFGVSLVSILGLCSARALAGPRPSPPDDEPGTIAPLAVLGSNDCGFMCDRTVTCSVTKHTDAAGNVTVYIRVKKTGATDKVISRRGSDTTPAQADFPNGGTYCVSMASGSWGGYSNCDSINKNCGPCQ